MEGLENILKVGEAEKNIGTADVNPYAQMIDDAEGLDKIENLQSHDNNEIYERAMKILETYWLQEEDTTAVLRNGLGNGLLPPGGFNFNIWWYTMKNNALFLVMSCFFSGVIQLTILICQITIFQGTTKPSD